MEAGLELRLEPDVDRTGRLYRALYEIAEVSFVRAGSQCFPKVASPPRRHPQTQLKQSLRMSLRLRLKQTQRQNQTQTLNQPQTPL